MRPGKMIAMLLAVPVMMMATMLSAESKNPADYPLRVHIFGRNQTTFYHNRYPDEAKGEGRADLYENGEAHGVDFSYDCSDKIRASFGYETYPARWKKPGKQLVVLMPVFGKAGRFFTCDFNTDVKDFAYASGSGGLHSETVAQFQQWMVRHEYDPEHGKDVPVRTGERGGPGAGPAPDGEAAPPPPAGQPQP
jgi:hypothetical protein